MTDVNLDSTARDMLERYANARGPTPEALARVRGAVGDRIAAGDPGLPIEPTTAASPLGWWIGGGFVVAAATAALLLGGGPDRDAEPELPSVATPADTPPVPEPSNTPTPTVRPGPHTPRAGDADLDPGPRAPEPDVRDEPRPWKVKPRRTASAPPPGDEPAEAAYDQVKAEMALLGRAQAALQSGDARDALRLLERHARTYPDGYLAEERMLQRMVALCELGRVDAARRAVREFMKARPGSPMASHASSICKDRGETP